MAVKTFAQIRRSMDITLSRATIKDCEEIYNLQIASFKKLLEKYQDYEFSPGAESIERTRQRLQEPYTNFYFICLLEKHIGAIRIYKLNSLCLLKQIFILPEYQENGYAQKAIEIAESLYPEIQNWELDTIKQEDKLCHLYEKMGYTKTGQIQNIKEGMDIVFYAK